MTRYSVQPRDRIFVKVYAFLCFANSMGRNIGKNISKNFSGKYSKRNLDHAMQSATDAFKTASKRAIQETAEATGDLIGNKIANNITKFFKNLQHNNSETVTNEHSKKIPKETYISSKERQKIIDDLRLK